MQIVNLSPIRWLQDPLAEYKKSSDFKKFENVRNHVESVEVVKAEDSNRMFNICCGDLGILKCNNKGGFDCSSLQHKSPLVKVLNKLDTTFMDKSTPEGWRGEYKGIFGIINSHGFAGDGFVSDNFDLFVKGRYTNTNKVLWFDSEEERRNCFEYITSNFMKAYAKFIRTNQRIPWQFVPYLDFTKKWTDEMLYEYFGLTDDEIKEIEKCK